MNSPEGLAGEIMGRIDQLAAISETRGALTRRYLTEEHRRANQLVGEWMSGAWMNAAQDAAGNMVMVVFDPASSPAERRGVVT